MPSVEYFVLYVAPFFCFVYLPLGQETSEQNTFSSLTNAGPLVTLFLSDCYRKERLALEYCSLVDADDEPRFYSFITGTL